MAYNIIDILDKTISIAIKRKELYLHVDYKGKDKENFELIKRVLIKSIDKEVNYYQDLKENLKNEELEDINFKIYDKISFLMNQFSNRIHCKDIDSIAMLIEHTLSLHKDIFALYISIQGKLVLAEKGSKNFAYEVLTEVLSKREYHKGTGKIIIDKNVPL